mgnify:CR=1 FL=1
MTQHLFSWYTTGFITLLQNYRTLLRRLEAQFAVGETFKHITEPLFQDPTASGRVVGIFFRLGRGLFALAFYLGVSIFYILAAALWALLPVLILVSIVGFFAGSTTTSITNDSADLNSFIEESL